MAKIQVVTTMTLDGFLPEKDEKLLLWLKTDKRGFPFWHERSTFSLFPDYPILDLVCEKDDKAGSSFVYTAEISDKAGFELLHRLSTYHLIDEIIIYILPLTSGKGIALLQRLPVSCWELHESTVFKNGICRLIYRKILQ